MSDRKPHLCPACLGYCRIQDRNPLCQTGTSTPLIECPTCKGAGVLWDPQPSSLEKRVADLEKVAHPQGILTDPELTEALKRWNEERKMTVHSTPGLPSESIVDLLRPRVFCGLTFPGAKIC